MVRALVVCGSHMQNFLEWMNKDKWNKKKNDNIYDLQLTKYGK